MHIADKYNPGHTNNRSQRNPDPRTHNHTHESPNNLTNADLRCPAPVIRADTLTATVVPLLQYFKNFYEKYNLFSLTRLYESPRSLSVSWYCRT